MNQLRKGFTLIELLVVIAIIAILAAILFPVLAQAKDAARKTACLSDNKQMSAAVMMYISDYDDTMVITNHKVCSVYCCKPPNQSWPQYVFTYFTNWNLLRCPNDPDATNEGLSFIPANEQKAITKEEKEFSWATRANRGYNAQYLSPVVNLVGHGSVTNCNDPLMGVSVPIKASSIEAKAETFLILDSIWDRVGGYPKGGGNWALDPPCRLYSDNTNSFPFPSNTASWWWFQGWQPGNQYAWNVFGGTFPFHMGKTAWTKNTWANRNTGIVITTFCDGHSKALRIDQISAGCDVKSSMTGYIFDKEAYLWDLGSQIYTPAQGDVVSTVGAK